MTVRVLLTGMSGVGKSTLVAELRRRGEVAYDVDDDGFSEPGPDGRWHWQVDAIRALLDRHTDGTVFLAGCSEEQALVEFDVRVLLAAPEQVLVERLGTRTTNAYGSAPAELAQVLADLRQVEPLLRARADVVVDATLPIGDVLDQVLLAVTPAI